MVDSRLAQIATEAVTAQQDNESRLSNVAVQAVTQHSNNQSRLSYVALEVVTSPPLSELTAFTVQYLE